jgi:ATP-dependent DNA helicase RecQ
MKVLIVAKTHMKTGACLGGLALEDNRMLRLLPEHGYNHCADTEYQVGQVWEMELAPAGHITPPHVEDVCILNCKLVGNQDHLATFLRQRVRPWLGGPQALFQGLLQATSSGSGYISHQDGLPERSTGFWIADEHLQRADNNGKIRYHYPTGSGVRYLSYVGYELPMGYIHSGVLLRVSLARWWRPEDAPDLEERCYLQLSGWYLK